MRGALFAMLALATALPAGAASFHSIVDNVEAQLGVRRVRTTGMGAVVNSFLFVRRPGGASSMNFATFEGGMPGFQAAVRSAAGRDWRPMITVHSKRQAEDVAIYVRTAGTKFELLIATSERGEATLVQMRLEGSRILEWLREPGRAIGAASAGMQ